MRVIPVFSDPPGKDGFVGFVQEKYRKDTPIADPATTGAVLVGQKEMCNVSHIFRLCFLPGGLQVCLCLLSVLC